MDLKVWFEWTCDEGLGLGDVQVRFAVKLRVVAFTNQLETLAVLLLMYISAPAL
jgi:hypothetical protein